MNYHFEQTREIAAHSNASYAAHRARMAPLEAKIEEQHKHIAKQEAELRELKGETCH